MTGEEWRDVVGFEGIYEVSDGGRVASLPKSNFPGRRLLKPGPDTDGYMQVVLCVGGIRHTRKVHHLVIEAFVGPRPSVEMVTRHLDGMQTNNTPANLRWGTQAENALDRVLHGRDANARRTHGRCGHLLSGPNLYLSPGGTRSCRSCRASSLERYNAARPRRVRRSFRGEANPTAKLTAAQVAEIRRRVQSGIERQVDIAASFGVSQALVSQIKRKAAWK